MLRQSRTVQRAYKEPTVEAREPSHRDLANLPRKQRRKFPVALHVAANLSDGAHHGQLRRRDREDRLGSKTYSECDAKRDQAGGVKERERRRQSVGFELRGRDGLRLAVHRRCVVLASGARRRGRGAAAPLASGCHDGQKLRWQEKRGCKAREGVEIRIEQEIKERRMDCSSCERKHR